MRLALQTDFALRTLMYLATQTGRAKVAEVAEFFGISQAHVAKVVNQLGRLGFVRTVRGIGGGLELARPAASIPVGEVMVAFEGNMHLLDCVGIDNVCVIEKFCKLKGALAEAERIQLEYLNGISIADVIPTKRQLAQITVS